jgi:membrane-bound lytic murein transglycosylase F
MKINSPDISTIRMISGPFVALLILVILIFKPGTTEKKLTTLEEIQQRGYLKVLTLNSASTYYQGINGSDGFEYQLAKLFGEHIGVEAQFITVPRFRDLYPELLFGTGDIVAAGLTKNESEYSRAVVYGPRYYEVENQILYRKGNVERPREIPDLYNGTLQAISGTAQAKLLRDLQQDYPDLVWKEVDDIASEELIEQVATGVVDFILADSHEIALQRRFFPELRIAFELGQPRQLRWAYNHADDDSLASAIDTFFGQIGQDGRLEQLIHRHKSLVAKFNYSDIQTLTLHIRERLPKYEALFREEAEIVGIDWRLLAAIGYQESLWNARAKSPTGVRGLMMLTLATAQQMKVTNRLDPEQSIRGGAMYFVGVARRIPEQIEEPDRTWLALASYNVGFGHVEDARKITETRGGDPNRWIDVKANLPLLARKKWYKATKYGYARGWEPVKYVENIRKYYAFLVASENKTKPLETIPNGQSSDEPTPLGPSL